MLHCCRHKVGVTAYHRGLPFFLKCEFSEHVASWCTIPPTLDLHTDSLYCSLPIPATAWLRLPMSFNNNFLFILFPIVSFLFYCTMHEYFWLPALFFAKSNTQNVSSESLRPWKPSASWQLVMHLNITTIGGVEYVKKHYIIVLIWLNTLLVRGSLFSLLAKNVCPIVI